MNFYKKKYTFAPPRCTEVVSAHCKPSTSCNKLMVHYMKYSMLICLNCWPAYVDTGMG